MKVQDLMVTEVTHCSPDTSLQDIALAMADNDCGAVPMIDEQEHPIGIITDRDIALEAALRKQPLWELKAGEICKNQIVRCCQPDDSAEHALSIMEQWEVRRLPVVNQYKQLCGIVSLGDIVSFTGAGPGKDIEAGETLDFLRHVSAHHGTHHVVAARP